MANFITVSVTWNGKQTLDHVIKPLFIGKNPLETQGVKIRPDIKGTEKLNYFGGANKRLKAYTKGFTGTSGGTYTQRDITVVKLKAEWAEDGNDFVNTVYESELATGVDENNLQARANVLNDVMIQVCREAVFSDVFRLFWLADPNKETISSGIFTGTADTAYNPFTGMLKLLRDNSSVTPVLGTSIFKVAMSHGATAQVDTITITGTSGTCNITVMGKTYLVTWTGSSLTDTAAAFVTTHAAALALRGITVTSSTDTIILTSSRAGQPFGVSAIGAAITGNLTGSRAATTANVAPTALSAGETIATLKLLFEGCTAVLKGIAPEKKVFIMDMESYFNWLTSQEVKTNDFGHMLEFNGVKMPTYRGVPIIALDWGTYQNADFPTGYPNHIVYTSLENLILGMDAYSDANRIDEWYDKNEEENRFRCTIKMGAQYVHPDEVAIAF